MKKSEKEKQHQAANEAIGEQEVTTLRFYGGPFVATIPLVFFIIWAITLSVLQLVTEEALVLGIVIGIAIGLFFCKLKWKNYAQ
ncbi:hypothetical protein [Metabacillus iocasae]|uniref:Uncharacterized membrane protein YgaE (UPF0421/DUF939 family) n=1 Tax=Priestia iocasae TaxID=2291674 RepID=A0ABS2QXY0_9BACI|nr:uncharacterized membrane protein YgaE (UPF0421/DUF939 family) [Metabacillus iocasae]